MGINATTLSVGKGYTNLVALGLTDVTVNGTTITFTLNDGETASVTLPTPKDGKDGKDGATGPQGPKGEKGDAGEVAIEFTVVEELPSSGTNGVMYLVAKETASEQDVYDEYMWIDSAWEHIGSTEVELSDYYTKDEVDEKVGDSTPIGTVISFMGTVAPSGYLICNGQTYNISDYPIFSEFIKTQFGLYNFFGGDGTTTFAVPDLRGEFLRGSGTNSRTNQGSGANVGVHQDATENSHIWVNSSNSSYSALPDVYNASNVTLAKKVDKPILVSDIANAQQRYTYNWTSSVSTQGTTSKNYTYGYTSRPTNTSVLYCIKYR